MCPSSLVQNVMEYYHLPSHTAIQKMYLEIRTKLFIPNLDNAESMYLQDRFYYCQ